MDRERTPEMRADGCHLPSTGGRESRRRGTAKRADGEGGEDVYDGTGAGNGAPLPSPVDNLFDIGHVGAILHQHALVAVQQVERRNGRQVVGAVFADEAAGIVGVDPGRRRMLSAATSLMIPFFTNRSVIKR